MIHRIHEDITLSQVTLSDADRLVEVLSEEDIHQNTSRLPYPYTLHDAKEWIAYVEESRRETGQLRNWAIRDSHGVLLGGIGFHLKYDPKAHKDEVGYWLGKPYWNRGILSRTLPFVCNLAAKEWKLVRIEAFVFDFNQASARVLEKAGFEMEGVLRKYALKNNVLVDAKAYVLLV